MSEKWESSKEMREEKLLNHFSGTGWECKGRGGKRNNESAIRGPYSSMTSSSHTSSLDIAA